MRMALRSPPKLVGKWDLKCPHLPVFCAVIYAIRANAEISEIGIVDDDFLGRRIKCQGRGSYPRHDKKKGRNKYYGTVFSFQVFVPQTRYLR